MSEENNNAEVPDNDINDEASNVSDALNQPMDDVVASTGMKNFFANLIYGALIGVLFGLAAVYVSKKIKG